MRVIDASAVVELVLGTARGRAVGAHIAGERLVAPELLYTEVLSALARQVRANNLDATKADQAVLLLHTMPVHAVPVRSVLVRAWQLRDRVRVTDAFYVACAERLHSPVVTCDSRMSRAPLPGITITLVE